MAYDEHLAERIRDLITGTAEISEMTMFGGLAFLVNGNMAVAASGKGGLLARVDPEQAEGLIDGDTVAPMEMGGRTMTGWLHVSPGVLEDDEQLETWVIRCVTHASTLPPKR